MLEWSQSHSTSYILFLIASTYIFLPPPHPLSLPSQAFLKLLTVAYETKVTWKKNERTCSRFFLNILLVFRGILRNPPARPLAQGKGKALIITSHIKRVLYFESSLQINLIFSFVFSWTVNKSIQNTFYKPVWRYTQ